MRTLFRPTPLTALLLAALPFVLALTLLAFLGQAFAQDAALPGVPAEYAPVLTLVIGLLSSLLVQPLTSIAKKLGRTSGPTTVAISAAISLVLAVGFALWQAAATREGVPLGMALLLAAVAFLKANGDYITRVFSSAKGAAAAPIPQIVTGDVTPPAGVLSPPSGVEDIPGLDTPATPGLGLLSRLPLPTPDLSSLLAQVLIGAGLPATSEQLVRVTARLAVVAPDLLDGDLHLSAANRSKILSVILELKAGGKL